MSVLTQNNQNPHNNVTPNMLTQDNYTDPIALAAKIAGRRGLPQEQLDKVYTDCEDLVKDSWLGYLDMFNMNFPITTNSLEFIETESPDYVIDDDGAVTRTANVFEIDWTAVQGYEAGEDAFFFREDDVIAIYDDTKEELGVITAVDKANNQFTAVCKDGANWTVGTANLTIDVTGTDFDRASCGPEGLMELRKKKSRVLKLVTIKDAMQASGGERWAFEDENGDVDWYDENTISLMKRLNTKVAKALMRERESVQGSAAYSAGKYGTQGLFDNLEKNGLLSTGYISTLAHMQAITAYWEEELGFKQTEFVAHVDRTQYRFFEQIAKEIATNLGIQLQAVLNNDNSNYSRFGFHSLTVDGYTIHFTKWGLTSGNSPFGKNRVTAKMPKGIIMPTGTVKTMINGREENVPYIFKVYQDLKGHGPNSGGMIRTFLSGGFNGDGDCEYSKITKSTTVGIAVPCPEAVVYIK